MKNKHHQKRLKNLGNREMIRSSNYTEIHGNAEFASVTNL